MSKEEGTLRKASLSLKNPTLLNRSKRAETRGGNQGKRAAGEQVRGSWGVEDDSGVL